MSQRRLYLDAIGRRLLSGGHSDYSPSLMSQACVDVLPSVEGAGISLAPTPLRVPLGWSSEEAGTAERAQTTLGAGPCLSAIHDRAALAADATLIAARWPIYFDELVRLTPYRSVASLPLQAKGEPPFGALDLYASSAELSFTLDLPDIAAAVAEPIAVLLSET